MAIEKLEQLEKRIQALQHRLAGVGPMRPGSLSVQYRRPAQQQTPFHQVSYTYKGQSRSEYVRPEHIATVRREIAAYKRFKATLDQLITLSIQASRIRRGTPTALRKPPPSKSTSSKGT